MEFVCKGFTEQPWCPYISQAISFCPTFEARGGYPSLTDKVRESCGERYPFYTLEQWKDRFDKTRDERREMKQAKREKNNWGEE